MGETYTVCYNTDKFGKINMSLNLLTRIIIITVLIRHPGCLLNFLSLASGSLFEVGDCLRCVYHLQMARSFNEKQIGH